MTGQGTGPEDGDGAWLSVAEAGRRLGVTPRAVRNRMKRGTLPSRPKGNAGREVYLPAGRGPEDGSGDGTGTGQGTDHGDGPADGQGDGLAGPLDVEGVPPVDELRAELHVERERREAAELRAAVAVREVELVREALVEMRADRDRMAGLLKAALERPSWLERLARAVRGR